MSSKLNKFCLMFLMKLMNDNIDIIFLIYQILIYRLLSYSLLQ